MKGPSSKVIRILMVVATCAFLFSFIRWYRYRYHAKPSVVKNPTFTNSEAVYLPVLLSAAIDLAEQGGREVRAVHELKSLDIQSKGKTAEGAQELVTDADKRSHAKIVSGFKSEWPNLQLISEEREKVPRGGKPPNLDRPEVKKYKLNSDFDDFLETRDLAVWIDPLDATAEFTEDLLEYVTVMVCVVHRGEPLMGVVHQPFTGKTYYGWVGKGHSLPVWEDTSGDGNVRITVSRSHAGNVERVARETIGVHAQVFRAGGAGYKTLSLLSGSADLYLHVTQIKKWDICAPHALLLSAPVQGEMTTLHGLPIRYEKEEGPVINKGLLATRNKQLHSDMVDKFQHLHTQIFM